jgi:hypothetical protein
VDDESDLRVINLEELKEALAQIIHATDLTAARKVTAKDRFDNKQIVIADFIRGYPE